MMKAMTNKRMKKKKKIRTRKITTIKKTRKSFINHPKVHLNHLKEKVLLLVLDSRR